MVPTVEVRMPGSTANVGAGFDHIAIAVDLWLTARARVVRATRRSVRLLYGGTLAFGPNRIFQWREGLGSSAASTAAGIVLANTICELGLDKDRVIDIGAALEGHADNVAAAVLGGAVIVLKESASRFRGFPLPIAEGLRLVFAVPRDLRLETRSARAVLPVRIAHRRAVLAASRASALVAGLRNGSAALLRAALDDVLHVPYRRPLVVGFDRVVDAALAAGAFGATLSGSGPSIVALTAPDTAAPVGKAMVQAWKRENVAAAWLYSGARTPGGVVVSSR